MEQKKNYFQVFLIIILLLVIGILSYVLFFKEKQIVKEIPVIVEDETSVADTRIFYGSKDGKVFLKQETTLKDPIVERFNSEERFFSTIYTEDEHFNPVIVKVLPDVQWSLVIKKEFSNPNIYNQNGLFIDDEIFSLKKIPNSEDVLFVSYWQRGARIGGTGTPLENQRVLYKYDPIQGSLDIIAAFDHRVQDFSFAKVGQFFASGKYVEIALFSCWGCGGHSPEIVILNLLTNEIVTLGKNVRNLNVSENGEYSYQIEPETDCMIMGFDEPVGNCDIDMSIIPFQTGRFSQ